MNFVPDVYDELRRLAASKMADERAGHTLDATALVHEVWLKLEAERSFESKSHYLRAASEAMRRILVDHARKRNADKRGGGAARVPLNDDVDWTESPEDLLALDEVLERFRKQEPRKAELVVMRYFAGLSIPEAAAALEVSVPTAERWWAYSRAWLYAELSDGNSENR